MGSNGEQSTNDRIRKRMHQQLDRLRENRISFRVAQPMRGDFDVDLLLDEPWIGGGNGANTAVALDTALQKSKEVLHWYLNCIDEVLAIE